MSYKIRYTRAARADLIRLFRFLAEKDHHAAVHAREVIAKGMELLAEFPFTCRKATGSPFLRELVISFGAAGYVVLFEIDNETTVTILAVRHQRENDYF